MYYCTDKASEYPLILGAERCKMITRTRSSLNTVKGWCLDNDIPAQYWFSTPVTVSGSHNRSCSCSHPGTHQAIINTSRTLILFIYSFSVLYFVPKSWQTFTRYTSDKLLSSLLSPMIPHRPWGAPRCGVRLLLLISPQDTHDGMTLNFVSIHLWLLHDVRETLRALTVISRCLEPGDAEFFCKFICWNLPLLQHHIIAEKRQHFSTRSIVH